MADRRLMGFFGLERLADAHAGGGELLDWAQLVLIHDDAARTAITAADEAAYERLLLRVPDDEHCRAWLLAARRSNLYTTRYLP